MASDNPLDAESPNLDVKRKILIPVPNGFNFELTVRSHGWYSLPPFEASEDPAGLKCAVTDREGRSHAFVVRPGPGGLVCEILTGSDRPTRAFLKNRIIHMLRLEEDLDPFYRLASGDVSLRWVKKKGAGRLLRSATVFEDLVKTICTTNCSWSLTTTMVSNLVEQLGEDVEGITKTFPTAETLASMPESFYREKVRAGYRAPYFQLLAKDIVNGRLNPEAWLDRSIPLADLKKEMKSVKGVGDYAAENLLKLLGRYEGLALDSWLRGGFYRKHNNGRECADSKIEKFYSRYGDWKGLAIWCDMTEHWH